ncbi:MAG: PilX N-terminal domain-containing pilus assembly protein [Abyssibacter sp.]|uniref:pilus assembly PilX family protein n=1 Tax=Abyssibacter sp. TaxID=2320200 RepID=UPI0026AB20FD|nr:PilX N-terminal domain-containing pilus assembly protein [Pseudomonadota bacterium]
MMAPAPSSLARQQGSVLLISLVMLLVLTVIGITTLRTTVSQERMSANDRDSQIAFQAAEIGLRDGERWINQQAELPHELTCISDSPCRGADFSGVFMISAVEPRFDSVSDLLAMTLDDWVVEAEPLQNPIYSTNPVQGVAEQPRFLIREARIIRDSLTLGRGDETKRHLYEVTAIGVGAEPDSQRVLQSTFIRRF